MEAAAVIFLRRGKLRFVLAFRFLSDITSGRFLRFARKLASEKEKAAFSHEWASFSAPIVNPPAHRHIFQNKIHNLKLACRRLDGLIIKPGQVFSFFGQVGNPTAARGYKEASAFIDGKMATSMGGSLCQLSGVIYNVALMSGMKMLERHAHSIDAYGEARYIPLGRDATLARGYKDLRFQNVSEFPVMLSLEVLPDCATARLLSSAPMDWADVDIEINELAFYPKEEKFRLDETLAAGEETVDHEGFNGRTVQAIRLIRTKDGLRIREHLSTDRYNNAPRIVRRGPAGDVDC